MNCIGSFGFKAKLSKTTKYIYLTIIWEVKK